MWNRLKEKFERVSEAETENAQMQQLALAHKEGETANATIDRFDAAIKYCADQGVNVDESHAKRMLLARPDERYQFIKQNYWFAPAATKTSIFS